MKGAFPVTEEELKKIRAIEISTRRMVNNVFSGEYHTVFKGRGIEFASVRAYQPGDDIRAMDWKVTARTGAPFIKTFQEERELTLMLLVDLSASGRFGSQSESKLELAAKVAGALAFSALRNGDKIGLLSFTDRVEQYVPPKKGRGHALRIIRDIYFPNPEGTGTDINAALEYLIRIQKKEAIVFLLSDFMDDGYERNLAACSRKHDLTAIRIIDKREEKTPNVGRIALRDDETGRIVIVNTGDPKVRMRYEKERASEAKNLSRMFGGAGIDQVIVRTGDDILPPLTRFFKAREQRRRFG